jgi:hypothetical protein
MYPFTTIYTLWVLASVVIGLTVYLKHRKNIIDKLNGPYPALKA